MIRVIKNRWSQEGGFHEILKIAIPLIVSTGAHGIQMFVDRTFLMWYDSDAISASMQAGMICFTIQSLFVGTVSYVNTFVAQYAGAKRYSQIGHAVWQGMYLSLGASAFVICLIPLAPWIFRMIGHSPQVQKFEVIYFSIMCFNSLPSLCNVAFTNFFTGRGKTKLVMRFTLIVTVINIVLDYCMVFGKFGFPAMGVAGAAWATVIATACCTMLYIPCFFKEKYRTKYSTLKGAVPDIKLFLRIIRFGLPSGLEFMLMMISWTTFVALAGKIGNNELNATAITVQIESLSFMPMVGIAIAVSTLVGKRLGEENPELASKTVISAFTMTFAYMASLSIGYALVPWLFMLPFSANADPARVELIKPIVFNLLIIVAIKNLFSAGSMIFSSAIKGAGDTKFVMMSSITMVWLTMTIPSIISVKLGASIYTLWTFAIAYNLTACGVFLTRFLKGKWKSMRVIEKAPAMVMVSPQETTESEIAVPSESNHINNQG